MVEGSFTPPGPIMTVSPEIIRVSVGAPLPIAYLVPPMITSVGSIENVRPSAVTGVGWFESRPGGVIVVEGNFTPPGPITIVSPETTRVSVGAPLPIAYLVPPMMTSVGSIENVRPSAVTGVGVIKGRPGGGTVVERKATPPGPITIVSPEIVKVLVGAPLPIAYLVPPMITSVGSIENARPSAVTGVGVMDGREGGTRVVKGRPTPPGPRLTVSVPMTSVFGAEPGPIA